MKLLRRLPLLAIIGLFVGCGAHVRPVVAPAPRYSLPVRELTSVTLPTVPLALDPAVPLIARAETEFAAGEAELAVGHRAAARDRFDAAIDVLLTAPGGARSHPRLQAEFEKLLDRIGAHETQELRAGDLFGESQSEPAAIDNLLAVGESERSLVPRRTTAEIVAADLLNTPHDLAIRMNDKILSYIELFQGGLRSFVEEGLSRGSRYLPMIQQVFQAQGLPLDLAYVPLIESAFKPTALSRASAKGMWQFELQTAREVGLRQNWFLDERSDPEKATRAAALYLRDLRDMFDGDWNLALAAYNAGQGRVLRAMKQSNKTDYWAITASSKFLPRETREYVPMILAAIVIAANPTTYGFEIAATTPLAYETVTVPDALRLGTVAEWLNVPVADIQALNPELRRGMTPVGKHTLKVPVGTAAIVAKHLADASPAAFASATFRFHAVRKGETLASLARRYKTTTAKLAAANDLKPTSRLRGGSTLMVPMAPASALASRSTSSKPSAVASAGSSRTDTYRVRAGDTLQRIARQFDTSVADLKTLNKLSSDDIAVGHKLTLRR